MLARSHTFTIDGLFARHVAVEVDVRPGLPAFAIVGLADAAVREARERIGAAIRNSGYTFPAQRITANLAPGDVPKAGAGLDLAIACALLAASGQLPPERLERLALFGELGLDGSVRASRGALAVARAAGRARIGPLLLAPGGAREALLVDDLEVLPVERLASAVRVCKGGAPDAPAPRAGERGREPAGGAAGRPRGGDAALDLGEVRGQHHAVRTLVLAAAGAHNLLLSGPPGTGKTMLARRLPSILPPLERAEALEVAHIHSLAGRPARRLDRTPPFRAPHHSVTVAGLIGGASGARVGEIVLAHAGVLFLDELAEFSRASLEALRQPLEEGRIAIARACHSAVYPARFMLVAATNPCPCGFAGAGERCRCGEADMARYRRRLSGALLDRVDLHVDLQREAATGCHPPPPLIGSAEARIQVLQARERQLARLRGEGVSVNAHMDARMLRRHVRLDEAGEAVLRDAGGAGLLSGRGEHRAMRVARTIADLRGAPAVAARDLRAALALRADAGLDGVRAA
ncbi:MAG TPA: YifB family Mg chelatase-like AAA ATPase [Solirubrobacteraceae bacterium]|jgi:magnesium chelatase family protein|nr:YifB family Mg chelatase-like AAA ATPase [Solirubrobacteraceae bacterium]